MSRTRLTLVAALLPLALGACGNDATAPVAPPAAPRLAVDANGTLEGAPAVGFLLDRTPFLLCTFRVDLVASGAGEAELTGAVQRWYSGLSRTTPFDTAVVPIADLRDALEGEMRIAAGQVRTSRWQMAATVPFYGDVELQYRVDGVEHAVTAPFRCGPSVPADAPPPEVTMVDVATPVESLAPGDTLEVTFSATAAATLWRSMVVLSGACEVVVHNVEGLGTNVARNVSVPIPASCTPGVPLNVTVTVMDGAARSTTRLLQKTLLLAGE